MYAGLTVIEEVIERWAGEGGGVNDSDVRALLCDLLEGAAVDVEDLRERAEDALAATTLGKGLQRTSN